MAIGETVVTVVGNISSELSSRQTDNGRVVGFWLRSNERRYDKDADEWVNGRSLGVRVSCWRRIADNVAASLSKGDPVVVTGRMHTNEFVTDGRSRSVVELEAQAVGPNLAWSRSNVQRRPPYPKPEFDSGTGTVASPGHEVAAAREPTPVPAASV
ncbi:hypothetical protein BJF85_00840 [Saccharomonospora sp. CUA-673]|uniref:single-stranded DNA-binding protein n=1 Tax=Saccharomonospora sp. CUA-673 TaxID=1904969 RepID=UPI00095E5167|nr:single-stranded DNA-binding protein [Saccharomonospora sp. CUA-673]OLT47014.1 hypothetical protein BJF85_00840 [Saccharomonospora sp. CUA-673]